MNPLWLALHFPALSLDASGQSSSLRAIVEHGRILLCDEAAKQAGIASGIGVASARSVAPDITLIQRNLEQESAAMQTLAYWAGGFTPRISLTGNTLLLEIGSCLRLFNGLDKLVGKVRQGLEAQHFTVSMAVAPAPLAAEWLVQCGTTAICVDHQQMRRSLEALSVRVLPDKAAASLARFGAVTLADVVRLPSAALGRRIGREALQCIARAFGEIPDPRPDYVFPDQFALSLELPASVENAPALLFAARRLTAALAGWLLMRQAGVRDILLLLYHRDECTDVLLRFANVTSDAQRFDRVLREQLERLSLRAPVESLQLVAVNVVTKPGSSQSLFSGAQEQQDAVGSLLERLGARLGEDRVYRLALQADYRPECADVAGPAFGKAVQSQSILHPRPLWLLAAPEPLCAVNGQPSHAGTLDLVAGPERIASGWWDSHQAPGDVLRDYFIARTRDERYLWIYRDARMQGAWFLHGYFS